MKLFHDDVVREKLFTVDGKTWPAVYASIDGNNVAHVMSFLNHDGTDCATTGTFVRRQ